jgi:hypothetical protein
MSGLLRLSAALLITGVLSAALAQDKTAPTSQPAAKAADAPAVKVEDPRASDPNFAPLELKLPKPAFKGTPTNIPKGVNLEEPRKGPRPPFFAPKGVKLLSKGKPVTSSDKEPIIGELKCVTDGEKEAKEGSYVELGPGKQWVQIDLKDKAELHAIVVWHYHNSARVYHDVVVQVADDADFVENVRTLFNNDHDNSSGLGVGSEKEYWETFEGKLIDAKGTPARFLRLYSKGSTADDQNHYTEVEVWGK